MRVSRFTMNHPLLTTHSSYSSQVFPIAGGGEASPACLAKPVDEARGCFYYEFTGQMNWLSTESADRLDDLQQIAAVAGARAAALVVVAIVEKIDRLRARIHAQPFDHVVEDALVNLAGRRLDAHLVPDAAQEGIV